MSDNFFCKTCHINCNSTEQLTFHESSKAHLDKANSNSHSDIRAKSGGVKIVLKSFDDEEMSSIIGGFKSVGLKERQDSALPNLPFNNQSRTRANIDNLNDVAFAMSENQNQLNSPHHTEQFDDRKDNDLSTSSSFGIARLNSSETQEYVFDRISKKGKCFICKVELSSVQQAEDHIKGKSHRHKKALIEHKSTHTEAQFLVSQGAADYAQRFPTDEETTSLVNTDTERVNPNDDSKILMCRVCKTPFSSSFNMEQHFAGKKHKKEIAKRQLCQNPINEETNRNEATIGSCNNGLNILSPSEKMMASWNEPGQKNFESNEIKHHVTMDQNRSNLSTPEIMSPFIKEKTPVKFERTVSANLNDNNDKVTPIKDNPFFVSNRSAPISLLEADTSSCLTSITDNCQQPSYAPDLERKPYVFDGDKGTCLICKVVLTSWKLAQQHLNGQSHQKKLKQWEEIRMQSPPAQSVRVDNAFATAPGPEVVRPSNNYQSRTIDQDYVKFDGLKGFCRACNTELTSPSQASQHTEGKPHKRNVQRLRNTEQGVEYPLWCATCEKGFTGQESAADHFVSEKHKRYESVVKFSSSVNLDNNAKKHVLQNGDTWFSCTVCRKVLNTSEQLNIHNQSPQHLAELNRKRGNSELNSSSEIAEMFGTPGSSRSSTPCFATSSPSSGPNSKRSSIDSIGANEQIKMLLAYGENPVVNIDHSTTLKKEFMAPSSQPLSLSGTSSDPVTVGFGEPVRPCGRNENIASSDHDDSQRQQGNNKSPDLNADQFGLYQSNLRIRSNTDSDNSNEHQGAHYSPNVQSNISSYSNNSSSGIDSHLYNQPTTVGITNYAESYQSEDNNESQLDESNGREGLSAFGNVTTGYRNSRGFKSSREGSRRDQFNLSFNEDEESSSDEDEKEDIGNRNIRGEEESHSEIKRAPTDETSPSVEVPLARGCKAKYYCDICKMQINSKKSQKDHMKGKMHQWNLSSMKAPFCNREMIIKTGSSNEDDFRKIFMLTKHTARAYQVELTKKAISSDCVVYLPTGTGKTMVSVLTMGYMLEKNPRRPVIFLVDKVLLVIQQARYIETEFENKVFRRASVESNGNDDLVERKLNLAFVCRGLLRNNNLPIWKHDIIVTTADYCINMLNSGVILWEDFSLAVLDEAHHCVKKHPYQKLIRNYHQKIDDIRNRPKILGLTASPAGKRSVDATYEMLQSLLDSIGFAKVAIVGDDGLRELRIFQSNPHLRQICVALSDREKCFQGQCIKYFLQCYVKLVPLSCTLKNNIDVPCSYFLPAIQDPSETSLQKIAENLVRDSEPLSEILPLILQCVTDRKDIDEYKFEHLRTHTMNILLNIAEIPTGLNFEQLKSTFTEDPENYMLKDLKALGLPCNIFYQQILNFEENEGGHEPAMIGELMKILREPSYVDWSKNDSMALVLVRERKSAKSLAKKLRHKQFIMDKSLQVRHLVGHGKRNQDDGMTVKDQHKVLTMTKQKKYHILVATSIAEEGIDINNLELVISMNPPSNVTALIQMRGRARKKDSHFVILCSNEEEMKKLDALKQQEENMMEAAKKCVENESRS